MDIRVHVFNSANMIIENGTIEFKVQEAGAIDPETGYRIKPSSASWSDPHPCNIKVSRMNLLAKAKEGESYTQHAYEVTLEDHVEITSGRCRLSDDKGRIIGEFSVSLIEPLEAVGMIRLTV